MIKIHSKAFKKILFHSLLFGGREVHSGEYKMVLGTLGGKNVDNHVYIEDVCLLTHGETVTVQAADKDYGRMAAFDDKLYKRKSFLIGWYCSIPNNGDFFNKTNHKNQHGYQRVNNMAIVCVVYPENFLNGSLHDFFKVYRLKEDLSENWTNLEFEIIDEDKVSVNDEIRANYTKLFEIFNIEELDDEYLDNYLDNEYS